MARFSAPEDYLYCAIQMHALLFIYYYLFIINHYLNSHATWDHTVLPATRQR